MILDLNDVFYSLEGWLLMCAGLIVGGIGLPERVNFGVVWGIEMVLVLLLSAPIRAMDHVVGVVVLTAVTTGTAQAVAEWWKPRVGWRWFCLLLGGGLALWAVYVWTTH